MIENKGLGNTMGTGGYFPPNKDKTSGIPYFQDSNSVPFFSKTNGIEKKKNPQEDIYGQRYELQRKYKEEFYMKQYDTKITELNQNISKLNEEVTKTKRESEENFEKNKIKLFELIGIVFGIFTLLAVNIQIFSYTKDLTVALGLLLILIGSLAFFISVTQLLIIEKKDSKNSWIVFYVSIFLLLVGTGMGVYGNIKLGKDPDTIKIRTEFNKIKDEVEELKTENKSYERKNGELEKKLNEILGIFSKIQTKQ